MGIPARAALKDHLKAGPAAEQGDFITHGNVFHEGLADDLVEGIVPIITAKTL